MLGLQSSVRPKSALPWLERVDPGPERSLSKTQWAKAISFHFWERLTRRGGSSMAHFTPAARALAALMSILHPFGKELLASCSENVFCTSRYSGDHINRTDITFSEKTTLTQRNPNNGKCIVAGRIISVFVCL